MKNIFLTLTALLILLQALNANAMYGSITQVGAYRGVESAGSPETGGVTNCVLEVSSIKIGLNQLISTATVSSNLIPKTPGTPKEVIELSCGISSPNDYVCTGSTKKSGWKITVYPFANNSSGIKGPAITYNRINSAERFNYFQCTNLVRSTR